MTESNRFIKNLSSNYAIFVLRIALGIYALPVCLHAYGAEFYGLYLICFGLSASMAAFDLGSSKSVFRYTVEYQADEDSSKFQHALNAGVSFNFLAAVFIAIGMLLLGYFSEGLFNLSENAAPLGFTLFIFAAINASITTIDSIPQNLLNAYKHFHLRNKFQLIVIGFNLTTILLIQFTTSITLTRFAIATTILSLLSLCFDLYLVRKTQIIKDNPIKFLVGKPLVRSPYSNYSYQVFLLSLIGFLAVQADRFIIASVLDVTAVTIYTIITKPYFVLRGVIATTFPVIQPTLTKMNLASDKRNFAVFSGKIIRVGFIVMFGVTILVALFYDQVLQVWLGTDEYNMYIKWGLLSLVTLCISMLYHPYFRTLLLSNKIKAIIKFSLFSVMGNVVVSTLLAYYIGFQGVIIGTLLQIIAELIFSYVIFNKQLQPIGINNLTKGFVVSLVAMVIPSVLLMLYIGAHTTSIAMASLYFGILGTILFGIVYKFIMKEQVFSQLPSLNPVNPSQQL